MHFRTITLVPFVAHRRAAQRLCATVLLLLLLAGSAIAAEPTSRPAAPDAASQARAEKVIRSTFAADYSRRDPETRRLLARRLIDEARGTTDDPPARFVLLREARDLAADAGAIGPAFLAIDLMSADFAIDALDARLAALNAVVRCTTATAESLELTAEAAMDLAVGAALQEKFDIAARAMASASTCASRSKVQRTVAAVAEMQRELRAVQQEHKLAAEAAAALKQGGGGAEAKLRAGRYLCFVLGDWKSGLELLAEGSDAALQALAEREGAAPVEPAEQVKLGSEWWDQSQQLGPIRRRIVQQHAAQWYRQALPSLSGLSRTTTQKRLAECDAAALRLQMLAGGLLAEIYSGEFEKILARRVDAQVEFDWGEGAPAEGLPKDGFSIRWTGRLLAPADGKYTLVAVANSGVRLAIDGKVVLESAAAYRKRNGERIAVELSAGWHDLRLEFWDGGGIARMKLQWIVPGTSAEQPIAAENLCHRRLDEGG